MHIRGGDEQCRQIPQRQIAAGWRQSVWLVFHQTVVLICQHDDEGAFGLILNRSSGSKVGELIVADLPDTLKDAPLFLGGPVQPGALSFLHADNFIPDANVFPNLNLGHSLDDLVDVG